MTSFMASLDVASALDAVVPGFGGTNAPNMRHQINQICHANNNCKALASMHYLWTGDKIMPALDSEEFFLSSASSSSSSS